MDIKIEFSSNDPEILKHPVRRADIELEGSRDAVLSWQECTTVVDTGRGTSSCMGACPMLRFPDGTDAKPSWHELSRARVLSITFEEDGLVREHVRLSIMDRHRNIVLPLDMYEDRYPTQVPWPRLDRGARQMVRYFNNNGLPTCMCCSGHPGTAQKRFWIEFRQDVTDADIARFMDRHTAPDTGFTAGGMFCARYDKASGQGIVRSLQYTAADVLEAMQDLSDWVADDMSSYPGHGARFHGYDRTAHAAAMCVDNMDPETAEALYLAVRYRHVIQDIHAWLEGNSEEGLPDDVIERAARKYVYDGEYDNNKDYWSNIGHVVQLVKGLA